VSNNKDPNEKRPGEKKSGTFHYNPGNMSGKTIGTEKPEAMQSDADTANSRDGDQQNKMKATVRRPSARP
jgi:hypothetical protein